MELGRKNFMFEEKEDIIEAQIRDIVGQEKYPSMTKAYYKGEKEALLVYDITRILIFENIN